MIVTYSPDGQEPQTWAWDPKTVRTAEAEDIEAAMGSTVAPVTFDEFQVALLKGGAKARRVLLWHLQRKTHPTLKLADVEFALGDLTVEFEAPELQEMRDALAKASGMNEDQREVVLAAIDSELNERLTKGESTQGKASSRPSVNASA